MAEDRYEIDWILRKRRQKALDEVEALENRLKAADAEYSALLRQIKETGTKILFASLKGEDKAALQKEMEALEVKKDARLLAHGLTKEQLKPAFHCKICEDTGITREQTDCDCKKQLVLDEIYADDPSRRSLLTDTFENFDLTIFRDRKRGEEPQAPRRMMEELLEMAIEFVDTFQEHPGRNLLFYGPVGSGKSYLCHAIARAMMDKGTPVIYQTSYGILELFQAARFAQTYDRAQAERELAIVRDADLLFIDDLGTESIHTLSVSYFFELINDRLLTKRSTVISTNLEPREIERIYSPRVFSRLFGEFELYHVFGDDLRLRI